RGRQARRELKAGVNRDTAQGPLGTASQTAAALEATRQQSPAPSAAALTAGSQAGQPSASWSEPDANTYARPSGPTPQVRSPLAVVSGSMMPTARCGSRQLAPSAKGRAITSGPNGVLAPASTAAQLDAAATQAGTAMHRAARSPQPSASQPWTQPPSLKVSPPRHANATQRGSTAGQLGPDMQSRSRTRGQTRAATMSSTASSSSTESRCT